MHGMVAIERQSTHDRYRLGRDTAAGRQRVPHDGSILLGIQRAAMQTDARAAMPAAIRFRAKPRYDVGTPVMRRIAQHDEIAARWALVTAEIDAAPGIDVDVAVRRDDDMALEGATVCDGCHS